MAELGKSSVDWIRPNAVEQIQIIMKKSNSKDQDANPTWLSKMGRSIRSSGVSPGPNQN
jgi:hypothetical protein